MEIALAIIFFLLGVSVGSFLNVVADRVPLGKSILSPPSHCFQCGRRLESRDMIPVISYIILKGRCRNCGAAIPIRSMLIELFTGLLFVLAWTNFGPSWLLAESFVYISMLLVLLITGLERTTLPHWIVYAGIGVALLMVGVNSFIAYQPEIVSSGLGLAFGYAFFLLIWGIAALFKRRVIGFGDVGMAGLVGACVGFPLVTVALYLAILTGGISILMLILFKVRKASQPTSFGIFLALGAIATVFWGKQLLSFTLFMMG